MNSMEEKAYFEKYGWEYDYISRQWVSPNKDAQVSEDELVMFNDSPENEHRLRLAIIKWGKRPSP